MKIKGSIEFGERKIKDIKNSLKQIIKQDGYCIGIKCDNCIFSYDYAEDGKNCCHNSILNINAEINDVMRKQRAKEILAKIERA